MKQQSTSADLTRARRDLIHRAVARVKQGFSPPAEIYRVEYRDDVDWSQFPSWAQRTSPEMFDGCCHEG